MQRLAQIPARRAAFTEQSRLAALAQPQESQGVLVYRRPDFLQKQTLVPRPETLAIDGAQLTLSRGDATPRHLDLSEHPEIAAIVAAIRAPLQGDLASLQRHFEPRIAGTFDNWQMVLVPADAAGRRFLRYVVIDGTGTDLRRLRIVQANGDEQRLTLTPLPP
jgi:hypothetical protein